MPISVVDLNEEANQQHPALETIEEEEAKEPEPIADSANEVVESASAETTTTSPPTDAPEQEVLSEQQKTKAKPKPKAKPKASDIVPCPDCNKNMTYKNLRYSHKCYPEPPPVKKHVNPKGKAKPKPRKPPPEVYYSDSEEEVEEQQPTKTFMKKKPASAPQPIDPATALIQHYQLLQQQMMKQKQERYNNLCQSIFSSKSKRR